MTQVVDCVMWTWWLLIQSEKQSTIVFFIDMLWKYFLFFSNVTKGDEGWYHCEAFNQNELIKSEPAFLLLAGTE